MNWSTYNQSLVRRGEILLGFDVINNWNTKLRDEPRQNRRAISLSKHFSSFLGYAKAYFHLPYRQTEGIAQDHAKGKLPSIPDYI
ncbi:MAG TPA: hypothetical protein VIY08_06550 [Candidatus Nitrosocosmicus sp.]